MRPSLIGLFLVKAVGWFVVLLLAWHALGTWMARPVAVLASLAVDHLFPPWAEGVDLIGTQLSLVTRLEVAGLPGVPLGQVAVLSPEVEYLKYGYGLPLLLALLLASRATKAGLKMISGALILLPFQTWGICLDWLKQVALEAGAGDISPMGRELIAFGYQFGYLVLPALVPVLLWAAMDRRFLSTMLLEATLDSVAQGRQGTKEQP